MFFNTLKSFISFFSCSVVNYLMFSLTRGNMIQISTSVTFISEYGMEFISSIYILLQTLFNLYLYNQETNSHKPSCTRKAQMRTICTHARCTKVITNYWDIRLSVTTSFIRYYLRNNWTDSHNQTCIGKHSSNYFWWYIIYYMNISIHRDTSISM